MKSNKHTKFSIASVSSLLSSLQWTLPFIAFFGGYQLLRYLSHTDIVQVPSVVGLHMHDAIKSLSAHQLNVRILAEKQNPDVPEGVILSQTPLPGNYVKPHQSIFLVLSQKPPQAKAPSLVGTLNSDALEQAQKAGLSIKMFDFISSIPKDTIIAQSIPANQAVNDKTLIVYKSVGVTPLRIFPDLKNRTIEEVSSFFKPYEVKIMVTHPGAESDHMCDNCIIIEQKPHAGALIDISKPFTIQVTTRLQ